MTTFPISIRVSPSVLSQWCGDEHASFEDSDGSTDHPYCILGRYPRKIELHSESELQAVIESGTYQGSEGGWDDRHAYHAAVSRITRILKEELR